MFSHYIKTLSQNLFSAVLDESKNRLENTRLALKAIEKFEALRPQKIKEYDKWFKELYQENKTTPAVTPFIIDKKDRHSTPLLRAAQNQHYDVVDLLIDKGATLSLRDLAGFTVADYAIQHNNFLLLEKIFNLGVTFQTQIIIANIIQGKTTDAHYISFEFLKKISVNLDTLYEKHTLLSFFASRQKWDKVLQLVRLGANISITSDKNNTLIHYILRDDALTIYTKIVEEKNIKPGSDLSLRAAIEENATYITEALIQWKASDWEQILTDAYIEFSRPFYLDLLIRYNGNLNMTSLVNHDTILISAIKHNQIESIKKLLNAGADKNACYTNSNSPIRLAVRHPNKEVFKTLLSFLNILDIETELINHVTLDCAHNPNCVNFLIEYRANLNLRSNNTTDCHTALTYATFMNKYDIVKQLISAKADVNQTNALGKTALDYALSNSKSIFPFLDADAYKILPTQVSSLFRQSQGFADLLKIQCLFIIIETLEINNLTPDKYLDANQEEILKTEIKNRLTLFNRVVEANLSSVLPKVIVPIIQQYGLFHPKNYESKATASVSSKLTLRQKITKTLRPAV